MEVKMNIRNLYVSFLLTLLLLSSLFGTMGAGPQQGVWILDCVDCPRQFTSLSRQSLALDANDHPHLAYGGDHLYYAHYDGNAWRFETADAASKVGAYAALVLDSHGDPHITYTDQEHNDLKYAYRDAGSWHVETVNPTGDVVGGFFSLAVDRNDVPHVGYYDQTYLLYAHPGATGWYTETVAGGSNVWIGGISLALDETDAVHLVYSRARSGTNTWSLVYASLEATGWHTETVKTASGVIDYLSLALDADEEPHIAFSASSGSRLEYAYQDAAGWHTETVDGNNQWMFDTSLRLDRSGQPHIGYTYGNPVSHVLKYAYRDAAGWHVEEIHSTDDIGGFVSLALDSTDTPHLGFYNHTIPSLDYAYRTASGWSMETVDRSGYVGSYLSLALDGNDYPT